MPAANEVQVAGGQGAIYRWRRALAARALPGFASGGAVTSDSARRAIREARTELAESKKAYEDAKHRRDATKKDTKARTVADKKVREAKSEYEDAKRDLTSAMDDAVALRRSFGADLTDWRTGQRRGENFAAGTSGRGLQLVDQLFDIAAETGGKAGKKLRDDALKSEKQYLKLEKAAESAATKLDKAKDKLSEVRDAAASMASAVSNAVRGFYNLGKMGESTTTEQQKTRLRNESMVVDGKTYSWEGVETYTESSTSKPTASSILKDTKAAAVRIKGFAGKLKQLAGMGFNAALLEELALLGVDGGEPIADALLGATAGQVGDINRYYRAVGKYSDMAGATVADANYQKLIESAEKQLVAAEKNAAAIQKKLETETTRVIKAITDALKSGVKKAGGGAVSGPGTGTSDSIRAWVSNGEHIIPADEVTAAGGQQAVYAWRRAMASGPRYVKGGPVLVPGRALVRGGGGTGAISLDGVAITGTLEIGGDGLAHIIDGRIETRGRRTYGGLGSETTEW